MMMLSRRPAPGELVNKSGAGAGIAEIVSGMNLDGGFLTLVVFAIFAILISEATNSTVSAAVTIPIILSFATQMGLNPIPYWLVGIIAMNARVSCFRSVYVPYRFPMVWIRA